MVRKQTKIICTIGPSSNNYETILKMANEGMDIARLNFSHGDHNSHLETINLIRKVEKENGLNIAILLDTKGPEIRLGDFENQSEEYQKGEIVTLCKEKIIGNHKRFQLNCKEVFDDVSEGNYILINDGKQQLKVLENNGDELKCEVLVDGPISSRKGCNIPGVKLSMPFISENDDKDIRFGCLNDINYIAASFTRRADDILAIKKILREMNKPKINIIAKIENQEGYDNLDEILECADGVMVARGDLGVEVPVEKVPIYQKYIIKKANEYGKPVITATQMLESMTSNPRCTRAEAADVANAVLDGSDGVMLSGESAAGKYPIEAVKTMAAIVKVSEESFNYKEHLDFLKQFKRNSIQDAIGLAISDASLSLPISAIVVFTQGGTTARVVSHYRPVCPIYAVTFTKETVHNLQDYWGVKPIFSQIQNEMTNDDEIASAICKKFGHKPGELIILSAGYPTGVGSANMMKIISIK